MVSELTKLCRSKGLRASFIFGAARDPHPDMPHNWLVVLRYQKRQMSLDFHGGSAV